MEPEQIGSVSVGITGDYSELVAKFNEAEREADQAGSKIAQAFTTAAEGEQALEEAFQKLISAGYSTNDAVEQMRDSFQQLTGVAYTAAEVADAFGVSLDGAAQGAEQFAGAADDATKSAGFFGDAAQKIVDSQRDAEAELERAQQALEQISAAYSLGEASADELARAEAAVKKAFDEANPALATAQEQTSKTGEETASLSEKLLALGEALAVTEALSKFGEKALEVASEQEQLVISLTALGGSAEKTREQLEEIDRFSFSNALEIDTIEAATQRLTAFGIETEQIPKLMQAAADSAAATGKSFDSVSERIANMALSGAAGARQLTTLGISAEDLGKQLGVTGEEAAKAFKNLDQKERVEALVGALDKFAGTAAAVANSTGGQFQNLKNDIHNLFETMGGELLPVANQVLGILRDDIVPVVKDAVEWFGALPAPIKTAAIDAGVLAAAIVPLTAGIAATSLALDGLKSVLPIVSGLLDTLGISASKAAAQEEIAAAASLKLGGAATTAGEELAAAEVIGGGLAATLGTALVTGIAAAVISLADLKDRLDAAHASMVGLTQSDFDGWLRNGIDHLHNAAVGVEDLERLQKNLKTALDLGAISLGEYGRYLGVVSTKLEEVKKNDISELLATMGGKVHLVAEETGKAHDQISVLRDVLAQAETALSKLNSSYDHGKTKADDYKKAQDAVKDAQDKLNRAVEDAAMKTKLSTVAYNEWSETLTKAQKSMTPYLDSVKQLASHEDILQAAEETRANKMKLLNVAVMESGEKLFVLNQAVKDAEAAMDGSAASADAWHQAMIKAGDAADDYKKKVGDLAEAHIALAKESDVAEGYVEKFGIEMLTSADDATKASGALDTLKHSSLEYGISLVQTVIPAEKDAQQQTGETTKAVDENREAVKAGSSTLDSFAVSAHEAATEIGSLSKDLKQLTEDFLGLGTAKSKTLSLGSAPEGYYWRSIGNAATGFKVDLAQIPEGFEIGPQGTPIPIPGYDWSKKSQQGSSSDYSGASYGGGGTDYSGGQSDTAASGGTYPGVVIHQAAGEVLLVAVASAAQVAAASAGDQGSASIQAAASAAEAASVSSLAVSNSADTMKLVTDDLQLLTAIVDQTVNKTQQIASRLALIAITPAGYTGNSVGGTVVGNNSTPSSVGSGMGNTIGTTINGSPNQNVSGTPLYPGLPGAPTSDVHDLSQYPYTSQWVDSSSVNERADSAAGVNVEMDFSGADFSGTDAAAVQKAVRGVVEEVLTRTLRDNGARY